MKTMAAALLCLLWQRQPSLVSQSVSQHPITSLFGLQARDPETFKAFGPLLGIALVRGILRYAEGLAFSEQLLQLIPCFLGSCNWILDGHSDGDDAFTTEVLEESLVRPAVSLTMSNEASTALCSSAAE